METSPRMGIAGTGMYVPERVLSNHDLEQMVDTSDEWIFTRTGMRERRIASPDQATSDLCIEAGRNALADSGLDPAGIDLIIVGTVTPDHSVPPTACIVQEALGCKNAGAFDVNSACTGFIAATAIANGLVGNGTVRRAIVIGAECMSRIVDYSDRSSCILFGDAAGAVVFDADAPRGKVLGTYLNADGSGGPTMRVWGGGSRKALDADALAAGEQYLIMKGNEVFKFAVSQFRGLLERQMEQFGFGPDDLGLVIPHQVNFRIIESALKKIDIDMGRVFMNLERYGNTSAASIPVALHEARQQGRLEEGRLISMIAFGAGLTWGSVLMRW